MNNYLFVYGTLLPDRAPGGLAEIIARLRPVSAGSMPGRIFDLGDYPGAVFDRAAQTRVHGQVFELSGNEGQLRKLDEYEEYAPDHPKSSLFVRQERPITLPDGAELPCWVYVYNRDPGKARPVPGGDYSAWIAQHQSSPSS